MVNKDISIETLPAEGKSRKSPRSTNMQAILAVRHYMEKKYGLDPRVGRNMERLAAGGYVFRQGLVSDPRKKGWEGSRSGIGRASVPPERGEDQDTHRGDERYHGILREMAVETGSQEGQVHSVIRRLFNRNVRYQNKILLLEADEIAGFLQDNQVLLTHDMKEAMDTELAHVHMRINQVEEVPF